jgi:hypothetical protein
MWQWVYVDLILDAILSCGVYLGVVSLVETSRRPVRIQSRAGMCVLHFRGRKGENSARIFVRECDRHGPQTPTVIIVSRKTVQNRRMAKEKLHSHCLGRHFMMIQSYCKMTLTICFACCDY